MERFQSTIEIDSAPNRCYRQWHQFEEFPTYMKNVKAVQKTGDKRWHWVVVGPLGADAEWDAEIDGDEANRLISWHSLINSKVQTQGAVRFDQIAPEKTLMTCTIQFEPPAGILGEAVANLLQNPHRMVDEALHSFKYRMEGTDKPYEKGASPSARIESSDEDAGYEGPYGLDNDLTDAVLLGDEAEEEDLEESLELKRQQADEIPYLASEGALPSEDLIDMQDRGLEASEPDVFSESLDVDEEDLASYTEGIDEEINAGLGPREEFQQPSANQNEIGRNV